MARCPFARWEPLPANDRQARMTPRLVIDHTAVDAPGPTDLYGWFFQSGLESHFFVHLDGAITQYMDTQVVAEANLNANSFAVSIETEDEGHPGDMPWTAGQMAALIRLHDWIAAVHPTVPRRIADRWNGAGFGYHSMWGVNSATAKPNPWTSAIGKTCPGAPRIAQFRSILVPALTAQPNPVQENDMQLTELIDFRPPSGTDRAPRNLWDNLSQILSSLDAGARASAQRETALQSTVDTLAKLLANQSGDLTVDQIKTAVKDGIAESIVQVDVTVAGKAAP
jgi:hypothetical protein